jgi:hypothetical protein
VEGRKWALYRIRGVERVKQKKPVQCQERCQISGRGIKPASHNTLTFIFIIIIIVKVIESSKSS